MPGSLTMLPEERQDRPPVRVPNKHMIPADAIIVNKELGRWLFFFGFRGGFCNMLNFIIKEIGHSDFTLDVIEITVNINSIISSENIRGAFVDIKCF